MNPAPLPAVAADALAGRATLGEQRGDERGV